MIVFNCSVNADDDDDHDVVRIAFILKNANAYVHSYCLR